MGQHAFVERVLCDRSKKWVSFVLGCFLLVGLSSLAQAQELDPFDVDEKSWISLERYEDKETRFPSLYERTEATEPAQPEAVPTAQPAEAAAESASESTEAAVAPVEQTKDGEPSQPDRSLNLPAIPGMNRGYDIQVTSTVEDDNQEGLEETEAKSARSVNLPVLPGVGQNKASQANGADAGSATIPPINPESWKDAKAAAKQAAKNAVAKMPVPFNVRLATLPNENGAGPKNSPVIKPRKNKREEPEKAKAVAEAKASSNKAKAEKAQQASCEKITAYRKRQLDAIESDRKTLSALRAAITEMGLDKKLDFMTGTDNSLNATPKASEDPSKTAEASSATQAETAKDVSPTPKKTTPQSH